MILWARLDTHTHRPTHTYIYCCLAMHKLDRLADWTLCMPSYFQLV